MGATGRNGHRSAAVPARRVTGALPVLGVGVFLVAVALAWSAPALDHGLVFGSFDAALHAGIGRSLAASVHNSVGADQARQDAVWMQLNWTAIHSGHLPLWNRFNELGLPELANVQSAAFSLPSLVAYAFPLRVAYGISVLAKILLAGSGCYACARVLGTSRATALFAGVVGELAGPSAAWAGWPQAGVACFTGWLLAFVLLVVRDPRPRHVAGLALVVAFALAGGFPEVAALLAAVGLAVAAGAIVAQWRSGSAGAADVPRRLRPLAALVAGPVIGTALAAPVWLPLWPVFHASTSTLRAPQPSLAAATVPLFVDPTWFGLPTGTGNWFGPSNYYETAAFVGPAVLSLALLALLRRARRPEVLSIGAAMTLLTLAAYGTPGLRHALVSIPLVGTITFGRGLLLIDAMLAILAAVGLDALVRGRPRVDGWLALAAGWAATGIAARAAGGDHLSAGARALRLDGLWAAVAGLGALTVVAAACSIRDRLVTGRDRRDTGAGRAGSRRVATIAVGTAVALLLGAQAGSLVAASASINTWSHAYLPENAAIRGLLRAAGTRLVALGGGHGPGQAPHLGLFPELNAAYGLRELAGYDAMTPKLLEAAWVRFAPVPDLASHELAGDVTSFSPALTSVAEARYFGVSYVLEPSRPPRRLAVDARHTVAAALRRDGVTSAAIVTGVLDDLEWLLEQPLVAKRFPATVPSFLTAYLAVVASAPGDLPTPPTPLGVEAARRTSALAKHDPTLERSLEAALTTAPLDGLIKAARLGDEVLYHVPGPAGARVPAGGGLATSDLTYTGNASAAVSLALTHAAWVTLAVNDEPGWSASTAGAVLPVRRDPSTGELEVRAPAGRHVITLDYWPEGLSLGLACASAAAVVFGVLVVPLRWRRRVAPSP